uniref:DEP domain containing 1B n=1 Tax=Oryzias sinensis TaxID=183150 RepID=A0A8C7ZPE7_9TELE
MPVRRHWAHFRCYDWSFSGSEAVDYLHQLLRSNSNFGPEVTRYQTLQLLKKFFKAHVIEDVKGRYGTEDFEDGGQLYRFPTMSPLKTLPTRPLVRDSRDLPRLIRWDDYEELPLQENVAPSKSAVLASDLWNKRHSVAIGDVNECKLIRRKEVTPKQVDHIWKTMTITHLQKVLGLKTLDGVLNPVHVNGRHIVHNVFSVNKTGIVVLENKSEDMPYWVVSAMKCLANCEGERLSELIRMEWSRDLFCVTTNLYHNMVHLFSPCVLGSADDMDLDELLATKLVTFMMEHHNNIFHVNRKLRCQVEEHLSHLKRAQIKYVGSDTDFSSSPAFCKHISKVDSEEQKVIGTQIPLQQLLEGLIADKELTVKDKRKRLKQFQKSYPEVYRNRFPTEESKAAVIPEKSSRFRPPLTFLKKPLQPFQRSWSFRA